jgi:hypothetical protein
MLIDDVERAIQRKPGLTATEIARELFGKNGYAEQVRSACQALRVAGRIDRSGGGRPKDPFRHYPRL